MKADTDRRRLAESIPMAADTVLLETRQED